MAFSNNYMPLFDMVIPSLVAGIAVYCVKKWSYPVFLICMLWLTFQIFYSLSPNMTFSELFFTLILPMSMNILYVSYILLPNVRAAYYDPRLRWWENKPRYVFSTDIKIRSEENMILGTMSNISEGGLFASIATPIEPNTVIELEFEILGTNIELKAKIVYRKPDGASHGIQFIDVTRVQKKLLRNIVTKLAKEKYEVTRPVPVWTEDLTKWFLTLIKTGKGFFPELPKKN